MSFRLIVVRHAETDWTRDGRYAGARDIPLNAVGLRQCQATPAALAERAVAAIYATPLERARMSAEIIAKPHRLEVAIEAAFREMTFGAWEGMTREEVAAAFPELCRLWGETPHLVEVPGGETLAQGRGRGVEGVAQGRAAPEGGTAGLVTP